MKRLVLVPGLACDETMWASQLRELAAWRPVAASEHIPHSTIEGMASAVLAAHEGPLVLCGASMGGMIAMEAARQAPQKVAGLALLGTNARPETPEMRTLREAAIDLFAQGRVREVIEPNVAFAFHADNARNAALAQSYIDFVLRAGADQLIRHNRAVISRPDARLHLPQLRCPTLVMCGDSDQLAPEEMSLEIASLVPGARVVRIARSGHMLTMEQPHAVNAALGSWLSENFAAA